MKYEILQKIYDNELELYTFIHEITEIFEKAKDREDFCRLITLSRREFREQKEQSSKTLDLIRELLYGGSF